MTALSPPETPPAASHTSRSRRFRDGGYEQPSISVHPTTATARTLLVARGWRIETWGDHPEHRKVVRSRAVDPDDFYAAYSPDGERYWHLDEALTAALEAEAALLEEGK